MKRIKGHVILALAFFICLNAAAQIAVYRSPAGEKTAFTFNRHSD